MTKNSKNTVGDGSELQAKMADELNKFRSEVQDHFSQFTDAQIAAMQLKLEELIKFLKEPKATPPVGDRFAPILPTPTSAQIHSQNRAPQNPIYKMKGSLVIVLRHHKPPPYIADIVEIHLNELPEKPTVFGGPENPSPPFERVARLKQGGNKLLDAFDWKVCSLAAQSGGCSITPDLCVFPNSNTPLSGYIFNLRTGAMEELKPPATPKWSAYLVSLKGDIYFFPDPDFLPVDPDCLPERYCHEKKSWEPLEPFPLSESGYLYRLIGYAVFDDFILFNMQNSFQRQLLAYDCSSGNWLAVTAHNRECYDFEGLGVVVENTLYALRNCYYSILVLSITRELNDGGDVVFSCCLRSKFEISDTDHPYFRVDDPTGIDHLVHLGDLKFCLVRTGFSNNDYRNQKLKIMVLQLQESQNLATLIHAMDYDLKTCGEFRLCYCFLLPPDLDLVVSKKEDKSPLSDDDIDFAFDFYIQNVNPALEEETETLPKEEETIGVSVGDGRKRKDVYG